MGEGISALRAQALPSGLCRVPCFQPWKQKASSAEWARSRMARGFLSFAVVSRRMKDKTFLRVLSASAVNT